MSKVLSFRVSDEEAEWAEGYVLARELKRQDFLLAGFRSYRVDCERGVPDVPKPPAPKSKPSARGESYEEIMRGRQAAMNKRLGWS